MSEGIFLRKLHNFVVVGDISSLEKTIKEKNIDVNIVDKVVHVNFGFYLKI
jgi:hypothetical protein